MPRGVYDRSKRKSENTEVEKTGKIEKAPKIKNLPGTTANPKIAKAIKTPRMKRMKTQEVSTEVRFRILTNNISTLVEVLSLNTDKKIFSEVVTELLQNFHAMKSLRLEVFGDRSEEQRSTSLSSGLSLSTKSLLPTPPNPAA